MRGRLFWKILFGFWITFFLIIQGIYILLLLLRPPGQQTEYMRMAHMMVAAAATIVSLHGQDTAREEVAKWPKVFQGVQIAPVTKTATSDHHPALVETVVRSPQGSRYRVAYYAPPTYPMAGLKVPPEVPIVAATGGFIFSLLLAWYITKPIKTIRDGFASLAKGNFATRLKASVGRRRDEIADLARDFDSMAVRLQELVAARDRLLADVSHELRTPLARLNLAVELARQDPARSASSMERISKETLKLDDMVSELLELAKLESSSERSEEYINLAQLLTAVIEDARYEARVKGVEIALCLEPDNVETQWVMPGNGKLIYRAIENIVRNAVRYSPEGEVVQVALNKLRDDFSIRVSDQGAGVPEQDMAQLFKPFGISADGSGFGLGLAIAQRAVAVHNGTIYARNRAPHGLEMEVRLPSRG